MRNKLKIKLSEAKMELPPIPIETVTGWKNIPIRECGEKLVPVGAFSDFSDCDTSAVYFGERGTGKDMNFMGKEVDRELSLITHFVREGVLDKLIIAQRLLPADHYFLFFDIYRPLEVQKALFEDQKDKIKKNHPDWDETRLEEETQRYVSLPSPDKEKGTTHPSPHNTGGVVDLTIIRLSRMGRNLLNALEQNQLSGEFNYTIMDEEKKKYACESWPANYRYSKEKARIFKEQSTPLNMGTDFDHFGPEAATRYFEILATERKLSETEIECLQNRRFLSQVMSKAGFSNYPEEWWHWSCGDNMNAANRKKDFAIYGGIKLSEENIAFENARRGLYNDSLAPMRRKVCL